MSVRRIAGSSRHRLGAALLATTMLATGCYEAYVQVIRLYYEYVFYPRVKEGYIVPSHWKDVAFLALVWAGIVTLFWAAYRLFKRAFDDPSAPESVE